MKDILGNRKRNYRKKIKVTDQEKFCPPMRAQYIKELISDTLKSKILIITCSVTKSEVNRLIRGVKGQKIRHIC